MPDQPEHLPLYHIDPADHVELLEVQRRTLKLDISRRTLAPDDIVRLIESLIGLLPEKQRADLEYGIKTRSMI